MVDRLSAQDIGREVNDSKKAKEKKKPDSLYAVVFIMSSRILKNKMNLIWRKKKPQKRPKENMGW